MSRPDCGEFAGLLPAYGDGELPATQAAALERHLEACADCTARLQAQRALGKAIRERTPYHRAPAALRTRLLEATAVPVSAPPTMPAAPSAPARRKRYEAWSRWSMPLAASLALALALNLVMETQRDRAALTGELIAAHVRSLQVDHLEDVASTDQHTVKPWFNGKLDYSPPVRDLAAQGFPLIGGRLDYVDHREVAALVYRRRQHTINVFVWPSAGLTDAKAADAGRDGYTVLRWRAAGMQWSAVSDIGAAELADFAQRLRDAAGPAGPE